jgi:hypothetical protein
MTVASKIGYQYLKMKSQLDGMGPSLVCVGEFVRQEFGGGEAQEMTPWRAVSAKESSSRRHHQDPSGDAQIVFCPISRVKHVAENGQSGWICGHAYIVT